MNEVVSESKSVSSDIDAAHARLRAHQSNIDYVNSRLDSNERRIDRVEKRMDDQSYALSDLQVSTKTIKGQLDDQHKILERSEAKDQQIMDGLNEHIKQEIEQEKNRSKQIEKVHRTLLRLATLVGVLAVGFIAFSENHNLLSMLG